MPFKKSYFDGFHKLHKKTFGYANREYDVEIVNIRVRGVVRLKKYKLNKALKRTQYKGQRAIKRTRCLYKGKWLKTNVYDRSKSMAGLVIKGPALIADDLSTTFIPPKLVCNVDEYDNLIVTLC